VDIRHGDLVATDVRRVFEDDILEVVQPAIEVCHAAFPQRGEVGAREEGVDCGAVFDEGGRVQGVRDETERVGKNVVAPLFPGVVLFVEKLVSRMSFSRGEILFAAPPLPPLLKLPEVRRRDLTAVDVGTLFLASCCSTTSKITLVSQRMVFPMARIGTRR
jgi:hypothetical protein